MSKEYGLTRSDVAAMFGVSLQTVTNWLSRGLLQKCTPAKQSRISPDSVEALKAKNGDIVDTAQRIEAYRRELRTLEEELEEQCKDMRFRIVICQNKAYLAEVFSQTFTILSRGINDQRIDNAVCSYIKGQSVGDIASRYGITSERVRQLLTAGVRRLERATTYEQLLKWNAELRGTVAKLRTENQMLRESIQASGCTPEEIPDELAGILSTKLADMPLSVRAHNCLYSAGISTLYDLVRLKEQDLWQFRNIGRRSIEEIKGYLSSLNLSLGMNTKNVGLCEAHQHEV